MRVNTLVQMESGGWLDSLCFLECCTKHDTKHDTLVDTKCWSWGCQIDMQNKLYNVIFMCWVGRDFTISRLGIELRTFSAAGIPLDKQLHTIVIGL